MSNKKHKDTERFYKTSYILLPVPIVASIIFASYVYYTSDSKVDTYCTVATHENAYQQQKLSDIDFEYRERTKLDICKDKDKQLDQSDGRKQGLVRWFICKGTTCGPGWEKILAR